MVNWKAVQRIHKKVMYHDKCDIYRYEQITNPNGSKSTEKSKIPMYLDVPCKISFSLRTWDMFTHKPMDVTPYEKQPKIFMEVEYKVEPGFYIEAHRYDPATKELLETYEGQAGLPHVLLSHQEVLLNTKGDC